MPIQISPHPLAHPIYLTHSSSSLTFPFATLNSLIGVKLLLIQTHSKMIVLLQFVGATECALYHYIQNITQYTSQTLKVILGNKESLTAKMKKNQKIKSCGENLSKEPIDHKRVKIKGVSSGKNLSKALKDVNSLLPLIGDHVPEKSPILIDQTKEKNLGTIENPCITHVVAFYLMRNCRCSQRSFISVPLTSHGLIQTRLVLIPNQQFVTWQLIQMLNQSNRNCARCILYLHCWSRQSQKRSQRLSSFDP